MSSNHVGPIIFSNLTAREQLIEKEEGFYAKVYQQVLKKESNDILVDKAGEIL